MTNQLISKFSILLLTLSLFLTPFINIQAEDIIYNDESLAVSTINSPITLSVPKPKANGTDTTDLTFSLINSDKVALLDDYYTLSIKSSNGTITPLTKSATGVYSSKFTTPKTGNDSVIDVLVTYKYYACDEVESTLAEFDVEGQLFYDEGGFSIVNARISQLIRGLTNEEMDEIIYEEAQNVTGLEDWDTDDREEFSDAYFEMVTNLKCFKPGESTTLTSKIVYVEPTVVDPVVVTPPIPPTPVTPTPAVVPAATPKPMTTYTPRTGSVVPINIISVLTLGLITFILQKQKTMHS